ncbi:uncharacterized protein PITG_01562 [Phytophthora infestans T30-4]|uniref:Uncharacterized protein n=1 Tax=Phytophthora infestans (strain T30-4) TaxID=403677 RepID=D0MTJ3_PHYIT|nr:uncharacterized protein PITG_01562 [Phytophthora infestans T30-4]EEY61290.1 hypothetical protein PITG_01562 [Phytophthora infestans T30-4]|eukprot:XP_002908207.1 hypothetical protein PITG_01562 [Phytophthora infestans T30-4]
MLGRSSGTIYLTKNQVSLHAPEVSITARSFDLLRSYKLLILPYTRSRCCDNDSHTHSHHLRKIQVPVKELPTYLAFMLVRQRIKPRLFEVAHGLSVSVSLRADVAEVLASTALPHYPEVKLTFPEAPYMKRVSIAERSRLHARSKKILKVWFKCERKLDEHIVHYQQLEQEGRVFDTTPQKSKYILHPHDN